MKPIQNNSEALFKSLIDISVESWRFSRLFARLLSKLDAGESDRYVSQYRYYLKRLEETLESAGLTLVNVEGHTTNLSATRLLLNCVQPIFSGITIATVYR